MYAYSYKILFTSLQAEGETQYANKAVFLDLRNTRSIQTNITIEMPKNIVLDSEHIVISAVGNNIFVYFYIFYFNYLLTTFLVTIINLFIY